MSAADQAVRVPCEYCCFAGHDPDDCDACVRCYRHGHGVQDADCPYPPSQCSNCNGAHNISNCPENGCQVTDCDSQEWTWLHPHHDTTVNLTERAKIHGSSAVQSSDVSGTFNFKVKNESTVRNHARVVKPNTEYATYPNASTDNQFLGDPSQDSVITNYIAIDKYPRQIHVYTIVYSPVPLADEQAESTGAASVASSTAPTTRQIRQRGEKARIFIALQDLQPLRGKQDWATDFDTIWTLRPLWTNPDGSVNTTPNQVHDVDYKKQSGKTLRVPFVEFRFARTLDLSAGLQSLVGPVDDASDHNPDLLISALNGMITKHVTSGRHDVEQIGANQFYIKGSFQDIAGIFVNRGYFSSIRPGSAKVLLNVNPMHTAFFAPLLVSEFLDIMADKKHHNEYNPQSLLRGRVVRIIYERPNVGGVDKNAESNRRKVITGFGKIPQLQQFIADGKLWTVKEWFETQGATITRLRMPCVNVGLPPRNPEDDDDCDRNRELWIPPEFLELDAFQPFSKQLSSSHMKQMHDIALRHPAANQASLETEGLHYFGVRDPAARDLLNDTLGLTAGSNLLRIPVQILKPPKVVYFRCKGDREA